MHERMKPIIELTKSSTEIQLVTSTIILEKDEKKEAIEYLKNDEDIDIYCFKLDAEHSLIKIMRKQ